MTNHAIDKATGQNILGQIGRTPTIGMLHALIPPGKELILKLEYVNPTFSIKDRTAYGLVQKALERGALRPGGTIIESSSGNLGKSLAMISASLGFRMIVVVDTKVSNHNLNWYRAYGAEVELIKDRGRHGSMQEARIARVQELLDRFPDAYWPNQYENCDNVEYHAQHTAAEYVQEEYDCLVGCLSTGGHLTGIAKGIKQSGSKDKKVMACDVAGSAIFGSPFHPYLLNGVGLAWKTANTDLSCFDHLMSVPDNYAISLCRLIASECGLLFGGSAGLNIFGALALLHQTSAKRVMAIVPDSGFNYLDQFYDASWLKEKGVSLLTAPEIEKAVSKIPIFSPPSGTSENRELVCGQG